MSEAVALVFGLFLVLGVILLAGGNTCLFRQCRWNFHGHVVLSDDSPAGLYQCSRCKTLSIGSLQRIPKSY